jgi:hypothetical protein
MFPFNMERNCLNTYQRIGSLHDGVSSDVNQSEVKVAVVQLCVVQQNVTFL